MKGNHQFLYLPADGFTPADVIISKKRKKFSSALHREST
jgi:elongation factor P hydroxylase